MSSSNKSLCQSRGQHSSQLSVESSVLNEQLNLCLNKLNLEDDEEQLRQQCYSTKYLKNGGDLIRKEERKEQKKGKVLKSSQRPQILLANEALSVEQFKDKLKIILQQEDQVSLREENEDGLATGVASTQLSTCFKEKQNTKSRQVSIHSNMNNQNKHNNEMYLNTTQDDAISLKQQEIFSTAQTLGGGNPLNQQYQSQKQSFFTQTNNSFVSVNNLTAQEKNQSDYQHEQISNQFKQIFAQGLQNQQELFNKSKLMIQKRLVKHDQELKLRHNLKRKIKPVVEEPSLVPMNVYFQIASFESTLFKKLLILSKGMKKHFLFYIFEEVKQNIVEKFKMSYENYFIYEQLFLSLTPFSACNDNGLRLDSVIKFKLNKNCRKFENKSLSFSFDYQYEGYQKQYQQLEEAEENQNIMLKQSYHTNYQFDVFPQKSQRWLWLHKDECQFHGFSDARSYTIPSMPFCVQDSAEISITLFSLMGILDMKSLKFNQIQAQPQPKLDDVRDYNRFKFLHPQRDLFQKYFADLQRVCEVEDTVVEWFLEEYIRAFSLKSHITRRVDLSQFTEQFDIMKVEVGGIDFSVWKIQLKAKKNCNVEYKYYEDLRIEIRVASKQDQEITNEIKRAGFLIDRGARIELRGGDLIIIYVSMGGFEK